eukprot:Opistho-2@71322
MRRQFKTVRIPKEHLNPRPQPTLPRIIILRPTPRHVQLKRARRQRWILRPHAARSRQRVSGVIRHGRDDIGACEQRTQAIELRHGQHHVALAPEFFQLFIDEATEVAGERHQRMRTRTIVIQAERAGYSVGAQQFRLAATQHLAFGVGRQVGGVADADGDFPRSQQARHQYVVDAAHHQDDARCLGAQAFEQHRQQGEFDVVGQADAEHRSAGGRVELRRTADRRGNGVEGRREQGEDFHRAGGRFHAASGAHEQGVIEQAAQARERRTDRRLAEKQFLGGAGHAAFVHQCFEHDQQVQVDTTQVITIHLESWQSHQA